MKFATATSWHIPGIPDENVYPVGTCKSPKLCVSRTQFPLAPQFAITTHVAQGQTIKAGVMTDLCIEPTEIHLQFTSRLPVSKDVNDVRSY